VIFNLQKGTGNTRPENSSHRRTVKQPNKETGTPTRKNLRLITSKQGHKRKNPSHCSISRNYQNVSFVKEKQNFVEK
jgi:hypothetical protein